MNVEGAYDFIKDSDGKQHKIHVDKSTKLEKVLPVDMVKAYVTDQSHTTTLQRDNRIDSVCCRCDIWTQ